MLHGAGFCGWTAADDLSKVIRRPKPQMSLSFSVNWGVRRARRVVHFQISSPISTHCSISLNFQTSSPSHIHLPFLVLKAAVQGFFLPVIIITGDCGLGWVCVCLGESCMQVMNIITHWQNKMANTLLVMILSTPWTTQYSIGIQGGLICFKTSPLLENKLKLCSHIEQLRIPCLFNGVTPVINLALWHVLLQ